MELAELKQRLAAVTAKAFDCAPDACTDAQLYHALQALTRQLAEGRPAPQGERKLYYFSAEFLMGKLLSNNLLALGLFDQVRALLDGMGRSLAALEEYEPEPSLGNGGLGRLAACFLDSIAALGLPGDGVGLNYHYGLFRQKLADRRQCEQPDPWLGPDSWLIATGRRYAVPFGGFSLDAVLYDIAVPGARSGIANRLHLFDVADPAQPPAHGIDFDKRDIPHCLTSFLYPDDSDYDGQLLRVYQQYFMVSAGAQLILDELAQRGYTPDTLSEHVAIQINDTHPSMVIPELIRLLTAGGMSMDDAVAQVERTCAYTNHTILAEALEKWPLSYIETVAPQLVPIIRQLDERARQRSADSRVAILDGEGRVHMAHMDIHYGHSVNGVAALHTEILKNSELKPFYDLYPAKFNNKTNGVTFRRWLEACDPALSDWITARIGPDWQRDAAGLEKLLPFADDPDSLAGLLEVKRQNKRRLAALLRSRQGVEVDENSIFDIQVKRLHEYKRQQMNALWVIYKYCQIKGGHRPPRPITVVFGAKAAPAYTMAKNIIHLILCLQQLTESDPDVRPWLHVVMVENYNVSWAEALIPACDISEPMDGANVEIAGLVGPDNIFTFGASSDEVISLYAQNAYRPLDHYHRPGVEYLVDFLLTPQMLAIGDVSMLWPLWNDMKYKDWFMALLDVESYIAAKERALAAYEDRAAWAKKMLVNIAKSGYFSSDRTIAQYDADIWRLRPAE